ncbi:MAG TPA: SelB C-terminal domain-containing protein, partial [Burkholderiales bacterium]|nr:SelB C-terminal domain-containing protein [Burkholderiales bacterium]
QIRGQPATRAAAGERCALNLTGADLQSVSRGDWLLAPELHRPTSRVDARITVLPSEEQPLRHWTPVHLHLATLDVTGRVAIQRGAALAPGESALIKLVLDKPVSTLRGDRFILRDQSATRTVGGGIVVDPLPPVTRRSTPARIAELAAFEEPVPETALARLAQRNDCIIDLDRFAVLYNLTPDRATAVCEAVGIVTIGKEARVGITREYQGAIQTAIVAKLTEFHREQPQAPGLDIDTLRRSVAPAMSAEIFAILLRELADARRIGIASNLARLPGHDATANAADEKLWQSIRPALEAAGYSPPPPKDLAVQLKLKEAIVRDFLHRKAKSGDVHRVTPERFYLRSTLASLAATAQATAQKQPNGLFTAGQYRDATGLGRSLAIEILEHLDRLGITQRLGDARKMRKDYVAILGAAPAVIATPRTAQPAAARSTAPASRPNQRIRR